MAFPTFARPSAKLIKNYIVNRMLKITILGAGAIGQTIGKVLKSRSHQVQFWDKNPAKNRKKLEEMLPDSDFIFFCFPSSGIAETTQLIRPHLSKKTIIVSLAKGLTGEPIQTVNQVLEKHLPKNQPFILLAGPFLAAEIKSGLPAFGVVATKNKNAFQKTQKLFAGSAVRLEYSSDVKGVALSASLKNVYALLLGIIDGLTLGLNTKGYLTAKAAEEMEEIVKILGGAHETAMSTAGLGDFITTGFSPHSRNRGLGETIGKNGKPTGKSEGFRSAAAFVKLLGQKSKKFPLLIKLAKINSSAKKLSKFDLRKILLSY